MEAVSVCPCCGVPLIPGAVVLDGGGGVTGPTGELVAELEPPALVAVTTMSILSPTSLEASLYVELVAPAMSLHDPPVQSCHW